MATHKSDSILSRMADDMGVTIKDLLVLSAQNDPFHAGTPMKLAKAAWFQEQYEMLGLGAGDHVRRMHYQLDAHRPKAKWPDGETYQNSENHWRRLAQWSRFARNLDYVDGEDFVDRRNPPPLVNAPELAEAEEPTYCVDDDCELYSHFPSIMAYLNLALTLPTVTVEGYEYDSGLQPYRLEVWIEKAPPPELEKVCRKYDATLVPAVGNQSHTACRKILKRSREWLDAERPVRVFYIADHDKKGSHMPVAVGRYLQFLLHGRDGNDLRLKRLMLTREQVDYYDLPVTPENANQTELDALEALHPGAMAEIVGTELAKYRDEDLRERMAEARHEAERNAEMIYDDATEGIRLKIAKFKKKMHPILEKYEKKLAAVGHEFKAEIAGKEQAFKKLEEWANKELIDVCSYLPIDLPDVPEPEIDLTPEDEADWLFDGLRDFVEQTDIFKEDMAESRDNQQANGEDDE